MQRLAGQIAAVQQMQQTWPRVEVVAARNGVELALPAETWLFLAGGQLLHVALGGTEDFCGRFVAARRAL